MKKTSFNNSHLEEKVKNLPHQPGCYLYKNSQGKVIYVGKAIDLRKRVSSYFNKVHNYKTTKLVSEIDDLDFFVVTNETESFLLEENLIKKYRPRFNILLNDDKAYPYIIITNEHDPQYRYVRKYDKKALRSYGPLPQGSNAKNILKILERLYPLRRCKGNLGKPCLYYLIGQCSGACFKEVNFQYYQEQIKKVDRFFNGNLNDVKEELFSRMENASQNLQFEEAQRLKELYLSLDYAIMKQDVKIDDHKNRDVMTFQIVKDRIAFVTLFYRQGQLLFKDNLVTDYFGQVPGDLFSNYLDQIYSKNMLPDQLIIPNEIDLYELNENLKNKATHPINKLEKSLFVLATRNADEALKQDQLKSQTVNNNEHDILLQLQILLGLKEYPYRIEMFDISNLGHEFVTGSTVV
jgi:excinuclease ABC subunit C